MTVDLLLALGLLLAGVVACMTSGAPMYWALLAGFIGFFAVGLHRGFSARELFLMAARGTRTSLVVLRILILIGLLTGLWRASGTIAFFVALGIRSITPHSFILIAFLLASVMCLAFGSSFGVAGTAGVILMTIARTGSANLAVAAGAVMSGVYVGERLSPASSAAALVAAVSGVDQREMQHRLWKTTLVPLGLTTAIYAVLSFAFPIQSMDTHILDALGQAYNLSWLTILPMVILLVLPWLKLSAFWSIVVSCVTAALVALFVQEMPVGELLRTCLLGCRVEHPELTHIMSGGGLISMVTVVCIVFLSCAYSGLFRGTGMLDPYKEKLGALAGRIGLFPVQVLLSFFCGGLFCNQAVSIVMGAEIMKDRYQLLGRTPMDLAINLSDSVINLVGLIPWCIACSVPLTSIGGSPSALPLAVYLYLIPLYHWWTERRQANKLAKA